MTTRYNDLTEAQKKQIRADMLEHGNIEQVAKMNDVSETVVKMVWRG